MNALWSLIRGGAGAVFELLKPSTWAWIAGGLASVAFIIWYVMDAWTDHNTALIAQGRAECVHAVQDETIRQLNEQIAELAAERQRLADEAAAREARLISQLKELDKNKAAANGAVSVIAANPSGMVRPDAVIDAINALVEDDE